jgi:hypothetical protein
MSARRAPFKLARDSNSDHPNPDGATFFWPAEGGAFIFSGLTPALSIPRALPIGTRNVGLRGCRGSFFELLIALNFHLSALRFT